MRWLAARSERGSTRTRSTPRGGDALGRHRRTDSHSVRSGTQPARLRRSGSKGCFRTDIGGQSPGSSRYGAVARRHKPDAGADGATARSHGIHRGLRLEGDLEHCPAVVVDIDLPAVCVDDAVDDGESDTRTVSGRKPESKSEPRTSEGMPGPSSAIYIPAVGTVGSRADLDRDALGPAWSIYVAGLRPAASGGVLRCSGKRFSSICWSRVGSARTRPISSVSVRVASGARTACQASSTTPATEVDSVFRSCPPFRQHKEVVDERFHPRHRPIHRLICR